MTTPTPVTRYTWTTTGLTPNFDGHGAMRYVRETDYEQLERELAAAQERIREFEEAGAGLTRGQVGLINSLAHAQERIRKSEADISAMTAHAKQQAERAQAAEARAEALKSALLKCREEFCWHGNTGKHLSADTYASLVDMVDAAIAEGKK